MSTYRQHVHIYAHRGLWRGVKNLQNTYEAIKDALDNNFLVEIDIRDHLSEIVISHDFASGDVLPYKNFLKLVEQYPQLTRHAINVKSDGLADNIIGLGSYTNLFFFDMSSPQMEIYKKKSIPFLSRLSDFETQPLLQEIAAGYWVDSFSLPGFENNLANLNSLPIKNNTIFVSPELHGFEHEFFWEALIKSIDSSPCSHIGICTDLPFEANKFFNS
jgi:glycerophosphoryl diester phosphodiesterase